MATLQEIFGKGQPLVIQVPDSATTEKQALVLDASDNISHSHNASPTTQPIEDGSNINDHVDVQPKEISFEGIMSEAPISLGQAVVGTVAGAVPAIAGFSGGIAGTVFTGVTSALGGRLLNGDSVDRVQEAFDLMQEIQSKRIPVTVLTGLRAYNNMILTSFNPVESSRTGFSLVFTATFKEIRIVKSESVLLPERLLDPSVSNSAASEQNIGNQAANEASDQQTSGTSILRGVFDSIFGGG